jgi:hypothetical protein
MTPPAARLAATVVATVVAAHGAFAQAAPRHLVLVPEAAISTEEGPSAASDVADVVVGRDGTVYVVQKQSHAVLVFALDGRPVRTLGRDGHGPGEFIQAPGAAGWRGDTLVVSDPYGGRLVGFLADGRVAFTRDYAAIHQFLPRTLLADGRALGERMAFSRDIVEGRVTTLELLAAAGTAGPGRTLARLPLRHHTARMIIGSGPGRSQVFLAQPFSDADLFDVDPAGRWFVTVSCPAAAAGSPMAAFVLAWRSPDGALRRTTTVPYAPARLPASVVGDTLELYANLMANAFAREPRGRLATTLRDAVYAPASYPPVAAVVAGNDGSTWVRRGGAAAAATWMVFDARGRLAAYVTAPARATLLAVTATQAWGTVVNENDVQIVTRFSLRPMAGR